MSIKSLFLFIWIFFLGTTTVFAQNDFNNTDQQNKPEINSPDSLAWSIALLKMILNSNGQWINLKDISDKNTTIWPDSIATNPIRLYLKNSYNDSLGVMLYNDGKGSLKLVVDDPIKFTTLQESLERKFEILFDSTAKVLQKVELRKPGPPTWIFNGDGTVGFTQTAVSNWAKGGENSLFLLTVLKLNLNYYKNKWKWESKVEFRYGASHNQNEGNSKKEDKIEFQSRLGYLAGKKWYYSAESNFRTQIAKGYNYPDRENPISAFMAPAYRTFSLGIDYKPNADFSLFLSPLTWKATIIWESQSIDPTDYGLEPGATKLRDTGVMMKTNWKTNIFKIVDYDTKVEYFNIYGHYFQKYFLEWEQLFIIHLSRLFSTRLNTQVIYDYNTKFPIYNSEGTEVGKEPKWQFKEFFTVGFFYKF